MVDAETEIIEWPVLFKPPMVRAILDGRKTMTRRVVVPHNSTVLGHPAKAFWPGLLFDHAEKKVVASVMRLIAGDRAPYDPHLDVPYCCPGSSFEGLPPTDLPWYRVRPKWQAGDRLWVRETHSLYKAPGIPAQIHDATYCCFPDGSQTFKKGGYYHWDQPVDADSWQSGHRWRPSIHMPRWACRLKLEITDIRPERLQDISEADAIAEGVSSRDEFVKLWDMINGKKYPWVSNAWLWATTFKVIG
jgi:hypothetical protein